MSILTNGLWEPDADTDLHDLDGSSPPKKLMFSLTERCNLNCDHCRRAMDNSARHVASEDLVTYVLDDVVPHMRAIRLGGTDLGEPLVSKDFNRFLRRVLEFDGMYLEVVSNMTIMDEERALLIARTCDEFCFSIEGMEEAYETTRRFPWSVIKHNLEMLVEARSKVRNSRLKIYPVVTCFHGNLEALHPILDLTKIGADKVTYRLFSPNSDEQDHEFLGRHENTASRVFSEIWEDARRRGIDVSIPIEFLPRRAGDSGAETEPLSPEVPAHGLSPVEPAEKSWICHFPFEVISILADGSVGTCCERIRLGRLDPGTVDLDDLWRGQSWRILRRSLVKRRWNHVCQSCEFRRENLGDDRDQVLETASIDADSNPTALHRGEDGRGRSRMLTRIVKSAARVCGFEIRRCSSPDASPPANGEAGSAVRPMGVFDLFLHDLKARGFYPKSVLDVGANCGEWTRMARNVFPDAEFLLIEPQTAMRSYLEPLCREFENVDCVEAGAAAQNGEMVLSVWGELGNGSSFLPDPESECGTKQLVPVRTIDSILEERQSAAPDLVKMDVQGFEIEALKGATSLLGWTEVFILEAGLFVFMPRQPLLREVIDFMASEGYEVYDFPGYIRRPLDGALGTVDVAFVRVDGPFWQSTLWE
jgi:FkbM family methyltransferase